MVTLSKIGDEYNRKLLTIAGLSTDVKPIGNIEGIAITNGSIFKEIDTGAGYLYNAETNEWVEHVRSGSQESSIIEVTDEDIENLFTT